MVLGMSIAVMTALAPDRPAPAVPTANAVIDQHMIAVAAPEPDEKDSVGTAVSVVP